MVPFGPGVTWMVNWGAGPKLAEIVWSAWTEVNA